MAPRYPALARVIRRCRKAAPGRWCRPATRAYHAGSFNVIATWMVAAGRDVQVDVTAVTFADVAVTRLLALTAARLGPGRRLVLYGASPAVRRLVGLCWPGLPGLEVTDE
jgi:STAS domain